jgi:ParB/Sulfiredoxin domain
MTTVLLSKITDNPFRDLDLYPLDDAQVDKLVASINRHGFFGGISARPDHLDGTPVSARSDKAKGFQIAMGHHRIAAARKAGLKHVDIDVRDISDDEMVRLMTSENAIQAGSKAAAVMNEIGAAVRRLAKPMLVVDDLGEISPRWPEIAQCFQSKKAYTTARGTFLEGDGIGFRLIRGYLGGAGDPELCPRSEDQVKDGLAAIKAAGIYAKIIGEVRDEIAADEAQAEKEAAAAEREAERAKQSAKTKGGKARSTKAAKKAKTARERQGKSKAAADRAKKAAARTATEHERIFDERCVKLFANDDQFNAFREAVTGGNGKKAKDSNARRFINVSEQYALAKRLMDEHVGAGNAQENKNNRGRISAAYIKSFVAGIIAEAIVGERKIEAEEREKLIGIQQDELFLAEIKNLLWAVRSVTGVASKLFSFVNKHPQYATDARLGALHDKIDESISMLNALHGAIYGKDIEASKHKRIEAPAGGRTIDA